MIFKLFKILASNIFSFGGIFESFKKGPKEIFKNIFLVFILIYAIGAFVVMYAMNMLAQYRYLITIGEASLMPVLALILAVFVIVFFGFTSVASNYYTGTGDEQLLSMPITPVQLFSAKFGVSFVTDASIGLLLFAIAAGIYGYNEHLLTNVFFYVGTITTALCFSSLMVAIIYLLLILVLLAFPVLRKKSILNGIASFFIIVFVIIYSISNSKVSTIASIGDMEDLQRTLGPSVEMLMSVTSSFPVVKFLSGAISGEILPILLMLVVFAAVIFGLIPLCGKLYTKTLSGFADIKSKKLTAEKVRQVIDKDVHTQTIFSALYWRDVRTVLREPTFFANGPLMVFLLPFIMIVSFGIGFASSGNENVILELQQDITKLFSEAAPEKLSSIFYFITIGSAAFCVFMGNSSSIAVTSFSREGKAMYDLKAMPVQNNLIAKAKFAHAFTYIVISDLVITVILLAIKMILAVPLSASEFCSIILNMTLINFAISLVLVLVDMFIDTAHPKLQWENPVAAFKQNLNSVLAVFITIIAAAIVVGIGFVLPKNQIGITVIIIIFGIIGAIIGANYFRYAEKRISQM